ncbi:MAG: hypothetical protein II163_00480, partial [Ruminococcus sp.]|nr:hypothetical protein [Ruminococcus sp.]
EPVTEPFFKTGLIVLLSAHFRHSLPLLLVFWINCDNCIRLPRQNQDERQTGSFSRFLLISNAVFWKKWDKNALSDVEKRRESAHAHVHYS